MVPDRDPRGRREGSPTARVRSLEMIKAEGPTPRPMRLEDRQWAGLFLFAGTVQFAIGMIIAEAVDPTYSVSTNYISDLGVPRREHEQLFQLGGSRLCLDMVK